jgi:hypothetical protein
VTIIKSIKEYYKPNSALILNPGKKNEYKVDVHSTFLHGIPYFQSEFVKNPP